MATIRSALESSNGTSASVKRRRPNASTFPKSDGGEARRRPLAMGGAVRTMSDMAAMPAAPNTTALAVREISPRLSCGGVASGPSSMMTKMKRTTMAPA
jgi:hypothetical protein